MAKFYHAEPGTNPMDIHAQRASSSAGRIKIILAIAGLLLLCGVPVLLMVRGRAAAAQPASPTAASSPPATITPTGTSSPTPPATTTGTLLPSPTNSPTPAATGTRAATQTPWVVTQIVKVNVPGPERVIEKHFTTEKTVIVYVTTTPAATQTPWIVTVVVTQIIEVTPTPTETPSPTATEALLELPTETPTLAAYPSP